MAPRVEPPTIPGIKMSNVRVLILAVAVAVTGSALASAQAPGKPATPPPSPAPAAAAPAGSPAEGAASNSPYSYDPRGRRDPFVSLLARGSDPHAAATRPPGPAGVMIAEASVKGILRTRDGFLALIQGTGTKTFTVRTGEKLMDGTIKAIAADGVVFSQDVNDPLSLVKQKEVRKTVRSSD